MATRYRYAPRRGEEWTAEEESLVIRLLTVEPSFDRSIAHQLGRTTIAVRKHIWRLRQAGRLPRFQRRGKA